MTCLLSMIQVNCGVPVPPSNASLESYPHTREGAVVTYGCDEYFVPSAPVTSVCASSALWIPPLSDHTCVFVIGMDYEIYIVMN